MTGRALRGLLLVGLGVLLLDCGGRALSGGGGGNDAQSGGASGVGGTSGFSGSGTVGVGGSTAGAGGTFDAGFGGSVGVGGSSIAGAGNMGGFGGDRNRLPDDCFLGTVSEGGGAGEAGAPNDPGETCRCTRRPGGANSSRCPMGAGVSVGQRVGPEGGTIYLEGTASTVGVSVELRIPPGALAKEELIVITETSIPPPDEFVDWSPVYRFEPFDLTFQSPVEVRMPWASSSGGAGGLAIYWSDSPNSCSLSPLDDYQNAGFNQASVHHLGWGVVATEKPAGSTCP